MKKCPACGGSLRFSIESQNMHCDYCGESFELAKLDDTPEKDETYEVNVFICPDCGGEILTQDQSLTGFCSYCGAPVVFESRVTNAKRPKLIIPFKKTKEDCKESYMKMVRRAIYAPKELKDKAYVDEFRGIYMPYWMYNIDQVGPVSIEHEVYFSEGEYDVTDSYLTVGNLNVHYERFTHDASDSFADDISERIEPYDLASADVTEFSPWYLCGFYGESADVMPEEYRPYAQSLANKRTWSFLSSMCEGVVKKPGNLDDALYTECSGATLGLLPVWFMSYRKKDRVAYATMNGQTGKVTAELPVDIRKYLLGCLLLTIPIFLALNVFLTVTPKSTLLFTMLLTLASASIYLSETVRLVKKYERIQKVPDSPIEKMKERLKEKSSYFFIVVFVVVALFLEFGDVIGTIDMESMRIPAAIVIGAAVLIVAVLSAGNLKKVSKVEKKLYPGYLGAAISVILAFLVLFINPVQDIYYYAADAASIAALMFTLLDLIHCHNIYSTNPLPQFAMHKGGDDRA